MENLEKFKRITNIVGTIGAGLFVSTIGYTVLVRLEVINPVEQPMSFILNSSGIIGIVCFLVAASLQSEKLGSDPVEDHNAYVDKRKEEKRLRRKASVERKRK